MLVTLAAVLVALRRDARLLAGLAWFGAYLAPVLVSTGEDRAEGLFGYLLLLGAGAVWLDRRRPWAETLLIAALGTLVLYGAWYADHFGAARFGVAASGLVLLAALFALGPPRGGGLSATLAGCAVAACGFASLAMAGDADRPLGLLALLAVAGRAGGAGRAALALDRSRSGRRSPRWPCSAGTIASPAPSASPTTLALGLGVAAAYVGLLALSGWRRDARSACRERSLTWRPRCSPSRCWTACSASARARRCSWRCSALAGAPPGAGSRRARPRRTTRCACA